LVKAENKRRGKNRVMGVGTRARKQRTSTGRGSRQVCREQISGQELRAGVGADIENGVGCEEMGPAVGTKYLNGR
jgi:hypothetical protein